MSLKTIVDALCDADSTRALAEVLGSDIPGRTALKNTAGSAGTIVVAFAAAPLIAQGKPLLVIAPEREDAAYLTADLLTALGAERKTESIPVLRVPPSGRRPYDTEQGGAPGHVQERMDALLAIEDGFVGIVVTSADAISERIPPPSLLEETAPTVRVGQSIKPEDLVEGLTSRGFVIEDFVSDPGEVALRGGIVDVFPFAGEYPVRIEFFGDEIESIREFDASTQRSVSRVRSARLVPDPGVVAPGQKLGTLFDFLPERTPVVLYDPDHITGVLNTAFETASVRFSDLTSTSEDDESPPLPASLYMESSEFERALEERSVVTVSGHAGGTIDIGAIAPPVFNKSIKLLRARLAENTARKWKTIILCDGRGQMNRLAELLGEPTARFEFELLLLTIHEGFDLPRSALAVYTDHQIFNRYHRPGSRRRKKSSPRISLAQLRSLKNGDFVVHVDHGIGRFAGMDKIIVRGREQEVVRLLYQSKDLLYVNINSVHKLHKYSGQEGHKPKLTRLGSGQWERLTSKTKQRVKEIARGLIKLYALRKQAQGFAFSPDTIWQRELEASFQYEDTPDQYSAAEDVKRDMEQSVPMDRLVCGDVGFGKTEIAVRAAFKAAQDGKQVAILAPTTILTTQHHKTFSDRLSEYPVTVDVISRFKSPKEQKETLAKVKSGHTDIIIGTQRLVSKDVSFKNLGLLIIDEEQRFGVAVKEKIRALRAEVDTLTLTATPIPRTLQFSLMGARDLSLIQTPPPNRQPIVSEIHTFEKKLIHDAIRYEVDREGQVFYVHNRVRTIKEVAASLESLVDGVRFRIAHGQMKPHDLEEVMIDFIDRRFDVLVCTNIVESGLDVANANTMIIDRADRFGLSDLHQLRGRVGRSDRKAFCYLLVPSIHTLTRESRQRLQTIEELSDLGAGFNIAMRDLDIRGAGNLLGAEQSGFVDDIGFETYHRILDEAVAELRHDEFPDLFGDQPAAPKPVDCLVDFDIDALIPGTYIRQPSERLDIYRRLAESDKSTDLTEISAELVDRFGPTPVEFDNLLRIVRIRVIGAGLRLPKIQFKRNRLFLSVPSTDDSFFFSEIYQPLVARLAALDNRYVVKEVGTRTQLIIQDVTDPDHAVRIMSQLDS